jgi:hypothetical protein
MFNSNFVKWDFVITRFVFAANSTYLYAWIKSLHCVQLILRIYAIYSRRFLLTF